MAMEKQQQEGSGGVPLAPRPSDTVIRRPARLPSPSPPASVSATSHEQPVDDETPPLEGDSELDSEGADGQGPECTTRDESFQVQKVLKRRHVVGSGAVEYFVQWHGYDPGCNNWEPAEHFNAIAVRSCRRGSKPDEDSTTAQHGGRRRSMRLAHAPQGAGDDVVAGAVETDATGTSAMAVARSEGPSAELAAVIAELKLRW